MWPFTILPHAPYNSPPSLNGIMRLCSCHFFILTFIFFAIQITTNRTQLGASAIHIDRGYHGECSIVVVEASVCRREKCRSSGAMQFAGNSGSRGVVCESAAEKEAAARTSGMAYTWEPPSPHQVWASTSIPHHACRQVWGPHVSSLGYVHVPSHA